MATPSTKDPVDSPVDRGQSTAPATTGFDVTELCRLAASALGPNEMIHDPDFSLYGAMSALELMDAKMDKPPPALEVGYFQTCILLYTTFEALEVYDTFE